MHKWVYLNHEFILEEQARLHYSDLAIQRGYGIFDFFKVINNTPVFLDDHLNRFYHSAEQMRLPVSQSRKELAGIIHEMIQSNHMPESGIRITLTGGYSPDGYQPGEPNLIISQNPFNAPTAQQWHTGIRLITYPHQRQLPQVKTIDYLMAVWLQPYIKQMGADDILYRNNDHVTECPRSNFFIVTREQKIVTPATDILKGITRIKLIETALDKYDVEERVITMDDIKEAREAFISSTTKVLIPVISIDQLFESNGPGPVTRDLYEKFCLKNGFRAI